METNKLTIGDKIKARRQKLGITQDVLARNSDVPYTTLTKIESNVIINPQIKTVEKIAKGLKIKIDNLIK
jgi:transcriptional regulator with XRE-family HTH domain